MGADSLIQWTTHTFNPWVGCDEVDPDTAHPGGPSECDNCYARRGSARLGAQHKLQLWPATPGGPSDRFFTGEAYWRQPAKWNRAAARAGVRARVFCASYADVFQRRDDLVETRTRLLRLIGETPWLDWLLLTKRPENMIELASPVWPGDWPSNVWAGTTVGVKPSLSRVDHLRKVPAAVRFLSMEPLLEDVPLDGLFGLEPGNAWAECLCDEIDPSDRPCVTCEVRKEYGNASGIHWVIVGGESGSKARPFDLAWARSLRDSCKAAGVAFFMKQLGAKPVDGDRPIHLLDNHGGNWMEVEFPADLRIREFPASAMVSVAPVTDLGGAS